jgi:hypothetical protein
VSRRHPLAAVLEDAAAGRFPAADGRVDVCPPDDEGTRAVVALTGHAFVLADVAAESLARLGADGYGGALHPDVLRFIAGSSGEIGTVDVVLVARGVGGSPSPAVPLDESLDVADHRRVRRARHHRRDVEVVVDPAGVVLLGHGLVDRREMSLELFDLSASSAGEGRRLIAAGLRCVPVGEACWAQVAPGNARSLRAFLACGFVPVGSEVLIT